MFEFGLRKRWKLLATLLLCVLLQACVSHQDDVQVQVVGFEPIVGEALETRFLVKLRLQNPSERTVKFTGVALTLETNGQPLASGVSGQTGEISRFGEELIAVPISVSAFSVMKQAIGLLDSRTWEGIPYVLKGRLIAEGLRDIRFREKGKLSLSGLN